MKKFTLRQLQALAGRAGVPAPYGLPLRALIAAVAKAESDGRPDVGAGDGGASVGLLQVHAPDWPAEASTIRTIQRSVKDPADNVVQQIRAAAPVVRNAAEKAGRIVATLRARGFRPMSPTDFFVLFDAAWQHSEEFLQRWADQTSSGDPRDVDPRAREFLADLDTLGALEVEGARGAGVALFVFLGAGALALWILSQWEGD